MNKVITVIASFILLAGCLDHKESHPALLIWNDIVYHITEQTVHRDKIGVQIGELKKDFALPEPKNNGESNQAPKGSKLYKINGAEEDKMIAVQINGNYVKAQFLRNNR